MFSYHYIYDKYGNHLFNVIILYNIWLAYMCWVFYKVLYNKTDFI